MTTQLQLIEGAAPPRPSRHDAAIVKAAAEALAPRVEKWMASDGDEFGCGEVAEQIAEIIGTHDHDGYRLAKRLHDRFGYEPDSELVEILEDASFKITEANHFATLRWMADWNIQPRLSIGDSVCRVPCASDPSGGIAKIASITKTAEYVLYCPWLGHVESGMGTHGIIVAFEDAEKGMS